MKRQKLRVFRMTQGLTQAQMAARLNISESHYKGIERGVNDPSYGVIQKFAEAFGQGVNVWETFKAE